jgi:hypothetical protein
MNSSLKTASLLALSVSTGMLGVGCATEVEDPTDDGDELAQVDTSTEEAAIAEEEQVGTSEDAFFYGGYGLGYGAGVGAYGLGCGGLYGGYGLGYGYGGYGLGYGAYGYGACGGCGIGGVGAISTTTAVSTTTAGIGYGGYGACGLGYGGCGALY